MTIKIKSFISKTKKSGNIQLLLSLTLFLTFCDTKSHYSGPLSPEESMKTFHFAEDFEAELFAAEPYIGDPVSMEFDEQGNAYVVDMPDSNQPDSLRGRGKIVLLKDTDEDGRADTAIVFADKIREATSVLPWEGGLLVAAAPHILYYRDTDGDGRADSKEILFTGFFNKNEEAQITNLRFGVDNWIYANNAGQAGEVTFTRQPESPILLMAGMDFRFRLDRNEFETTTGTGQFGLALDDWGHRFFTSNSTHIRQAVIPSRYIKQNPFLPSDIGSAQVNISDHDPLMYQLTETPYWRQMRTDQRNTLYQEKKMDQTEYARDHFTGATGGTFYGGDGFPEAYYGNIFTGEVSGNLVHRDILAYGDSTPFYVAKRAALEQNKEFLAATDTWFRPTSFTTGPDGYLYVVDMYRQHIETPVSIPDDLKVGMDFLAGNDMGRIYRIVPKNMGPHKRMTPQLKNMSSRDLVSLLSHPNQWWRLQAQRLLLERQDKVVISAIKALFEQGSDAKGRLHALYTLEGMDALDVSIVQAAMKDISPGVRENAVILSERFPKCLPLLINMVSDPSTRVAFQAVLSIGRFKDNAISPALARVITQRGQSPWFRKAVLCSEAGSGIDLINALGKTDFFSKPIPPWKLTFLETISDIIGARNQKKEIASLLKTISQFDIAERNDFQRSMIKGLIEGQERAEYVSPLLKEKLKTIDTASGSDISKVINDVRKLYTG